MSWGFGAKAPRIPKIGIKWLSVGIKYRSLNPNFANKISNIIYILKKKCNFSEGLWRLLIKTNIVLHTAQVTFNTNLIFTYEKLQNPQSHFLLSKVCWCTLCQTHNLQAIIQQKLSIKFCNFLVFSYLLNQQQTALSNRKSSLDSLWQKFTTNNHSFSIHYKPTVHTGI